MLKRIFLRKHTKGKQFIFSQYFKKIFVQVSGAGELPPYAFSEPDLNLSAHPAPIIQPPG
jgi:hypothetical protein